MMVLADTSVWIEHFRRGEPTLAERLSVGLVLIHPYVFGELACGNLKNRAAVLSDLNTLPSAKQVPDGDALQLIEGRRLWGHGLGWVDVHLLASALLSNCRLWTLDKRLERVASNLGLGWTTRQPAGPGAR
jgi:predicted nucleic acid-binding protein